MKKRSILGLVILMGISLIGIIAVQFYWFNNSVTIRNELFDRSVNEAINKAVRRLEMGHDLKIIRNFADNDSSGRNGLIPVPPPPPPPITEFENIDVVVKRDSIVGRITLITSKNNKRIRDSVFISEFPWMENKIVKKIDQLKKLSRQIAIEYRGWESGRHIDERQLKKFLKEELMNKGIPIGFNYTINSKDSVGHTIISNAHLKTWYKVNLFPDDIFGNNLELAVSFPDRNLFIGRATSLLLGLSVVFSLIIFITFSLSIFLIIRQKNISEMKSDFINNMTHEFKTPIATISIAADSILNDKVIHEEERIRFFTGMIKKENHRMNEQVERILQIARLDRKELDFNFQSVNAHVLIEEAVEGILLQVEKKGGRIDTKLEAPNPVVSTDPIHFLNLVYNLLDNANKYSPDSPFITVTTDNNPKGLILSIEDRGIGMSKAILSRIFDKFYRLPSGNIHTVKGFGLGLSYVKAILEINGGNIKVFSDPGKGSRFVVFVPFFISRQ